MPLTPYDIERRNAKLFGKKPEEKKQYRIPKKSAKKLNEEKQAKDENGDTELVVWFRNRIKQLTGYCGECGCRTETKIYQYAIFSCCHILEKRQTMFPSVRVHPKNFIELCPDHHHLFDSATWIERELMGCWNVVWERLLLVYPSIDKSELHHLPTELRERIGKIISQSIKQ